MRATLLSWGEPKPKPTKRNGHNERNATRHSRSFGRSSGERGRRVGGSNEAAKRRVSVGCAQQPTIKPKSEIQCVGEQRRGGGRKTERGAIV